MDPRRILQSLLRGRSRRHAVSPLILPVHRTFARSRYPMPPRQGRNPLRRRRRLDGDSRRRHGASECAAQLRSRSGPVSGLRLGHGYRSHRDAEIWHAGSARLLRGRCPLAIALRLSPARLADACRGIEPVMMKLTLGWLKEHLKTDRPLDESAGKPIQVVCGAPNARAGMKGVFAPPGAFIPGKNITLGVGKIRDVESRGMLVSEFELQISDDHEGIIELPDDAPVGEPYAKYAGLDDPMIEINLTPNRGDCTGVHGLARDLAAAGMGKLQTAAIT